MTTLIKTVQRTAHKTIGLLAICLSLAACGPENLDELSSIDLGEVDRYELTLDQERVLEPFDSDEHPDVIADDEDHFDEETRAAIDDVDDEIVNVL